MHNLVQKLVQLFHEFALKKTHSSNLYLQRQTKYTTYLKEDILGKKNIFWYEPLFAYSSYLTHCTLNSKFLSLTYNTLFLEISHSVFCQHVSHLFYCLQEKSFTIVQICHHLQPVLSIQNLLFDCLKEKFQYWVFLRCRDECR